MPTEPTHTLTWDDLVRAHESYAEREAVRSRQRAEHAERVLAAIPKVLHAEPEVTAILASFDWPLHPAVAQRLSDRLQAKMDALCP